MKKTITITNKAHKINEIELFIDEISSRYELFSTYHSNMTMVSDLIFDIICQLPNEHQISVILEQDADALHFIWRFDKELFNFLVTAIQDRSFDLNLMLEKLSDSFYLVRENFELHIYFATGSINHQLSLNRRKDLQKYFKFLIKQKHFNDSL
jgi:hypothetical protein